MLFSAFEQQGNTLLYFTSWTYVQPQHVIDSFLVADVTNAILRSPA